MIRVANFFIDRTSPAREPHFRGHETAQNAQMAVVFHFHKALFDGAAEAEGCTKVFLFTSAAIVVLYAAVRQRAI